MANAAERRRCTGSALALVLLLSFWGHPSADDCNGNGLNDPEDIQSGLSEDCNGNRIPDECEVTSIQFGTPGGYFLATKPLAIESGDLNRDGFPDLVARNASAFSVLLNRGDGSFKSAVEYQETISLSALCLGDLDQDDFLDVVVGGGSSLLVFKNEGDGRFASPASFIVSNEITSLVAVDVNNDGALDVVAVHSETGRVAVHLNDGKAHLSDAGSFPVGEEPSSVVAHDYNGDGFFDLATSNKSSRDVSILLNNRLGSLEAAVNYFLDETAPSAVVAGDLNRDGAVDLVVRNRSSLSILLGKGDGTFELPVAHPSSDPLLSVSLSDLDGDGDLDAAMSSAGKTMTVQVNDGDGLSHIALELPLPSAARDLTHGDFNQDGRMDLAALGSNALLVFTNGEDGLTSLFFNPPVKYDVQGHPHTASMGDLDRDGDVDVVTGNRGEGISVLMNEGDGTFRPLATYPGNSFTILTADLDNDGDLDLASAPEGSNRLQVLKNRGDGTYERATDYTVGGNTFHVTAGDLDKDTFLDLIISNPSTNNLTLFFNSGDGTFGRRDSVRVESGPVGAATSDLDGDGGIDIAVANSSSANVVVFRNTGDGSFEEGIGYPVITGRPDFIVTDDLDLDGHRDLATANATGSVSVFWNRGDGSFDGAVQFPLGHRPYSLVTADLDGDGSLDLVTANAPDNTVSIFLNRGDRRFALTNEFSITSFPGVVMAADLDADGDMDLVSANRGSGDLAVLLSKTPLPAGDYLETICTVADFFKVSVPSRAGDPQERVTKFVLPAREDPTLLSTVFQNAKHFLLHEEFLRQVFPDRFGNLSGEEYDELAGRRATRDYYVGAIRRGMARDQDHGPFYTFSAVADTGFDFEEALKENEVKRVYETLGQSFLLRPFLYEPEGELARRQAETWEDPPFEIFFADGETDIQYEPYTLATGYGRVRILTLQEFNDPTQCGRFTFQDILVLDLAPRDIEGVVGGVITGERQGELSHVAIRTARRETPNAFVADALEAFKDFEGKLVRLEVFETEYFATEVSQEEAETFWVVHRPSLPRLPDLDENTRSLDSLLEMDLSGADGIAPVARWGGKASNLARLQRILLGEYEKYRLRGFAIPMVYYLDFMRQNTVEVNGRTLTYEAYLEELLSSPEVRTDSPVRCETLDQFRDFVRQNGVVEPELIQRLADRIVEVFGSPAPMVRFRSSSNIEDTLVFNGAGLYESTSVCVEDSFDIGSFGPSHCDPETSNERTIERALKKVWSSLWTFRAYEEREFYQIPQELAAMGILCNRAFRSERVNGVAFTGSQRNIRDKRYVVTAQIFESSVVSPEPGVSPERDILEVVDGQVLDVIRARSSSLVPPGEKVLSDNQLQELGELMWHIDQHFPIDLEGHAGGEVVLDLEFKIDWDGSLVVKQVRPFLITASTLKTPTFELEIPPGSEVCGVFSPVRAGREPRVEYETKSRVRFVEGTLELPTDTETFSADLIRELRFGADQALARPSGPGTFTVTRKAEGSETVYRFDYSQKFTLPGERSFDLKLFNLAFRGRGETALDKTRLLEEKFLNSELFSMEGTLEGEPVVSYGSCTYGQLPLWEVDLLLAGESYIKLRERFLPSENNLSTGPASLIRADISIEGQRQTITDYWRLVYSARRHNRDVRYWVVLDPPVELESLGGAVHVIEVIPITDSEAQVNTLGSNFQLLASLEVLSFNKDLADEPLEVRFRRGDANGDGGIGAADAVGLIGYLFLGANALPCLKAADASDDGKLNISDPLAILKHLFGGVAALGEPFGSCGGDPTEDGLSCLSYPRCQ